MTTAYSTLLGLALPVQGELSGTWGDTVDNGITRYLDIAVAGTVTLTGDGAVTMSLTNGDSSATNIVSSLTGAGTVSAQFAIIRVTGTLTVAKVLTPPSSSRTYVVVNAATGSTVTVKASGQTGVSIAVGETAFVYFNGTDYVKLVGTATAGAAGGSTTQVQYNNAGVLAGITGATTNGTALTLVAPILGTPASGVATNLTGLPLTTGVTGILPTASGGTGLTTYTAGDLPYYATGTALSKLGIGTNGQILTSSGTAPQWSTLSGVAVTTFSAGTTGFTPNTATSGAVTLAGTLATTNGGTNLTSFTANQVFYASSTSAFAQSTNLQFSGTDLTVYGITVGRGAGAVSSNTAVGANALAANTTGSFNDAFGYTALTSITTGQQNVGFGAQSLNKTTTGTRNSGFGVAALYNNTTGDQNTGIGASSLFSSSTASYNTAVGYQAGYSNTTGAGNTFFGYTAGTAVTTGSNLTVIGNTAAASSATATNEVTIGNSSVIVTRLGGTTVVASLPSAATVGAGAIAFVTNALAPTFGSTVVGGGAVSVPVYSDGTNWKVG